MTSSNSQKWDCALSRHSSAAGAFEQTARAINGDSWTTPVAAGKWTPAQITQHLNQTYEVILGELKGEKGIRIRSPWLLRQVLRQTILRSIYRKRQLPKGARAPSEIVPKVVNGSQLELLDRFAHLAAEFKDRCDSNRQKKLKLTHHIFGEIELLPGIDFIAIHIEHHHRQLLAETAPN